MSFLFPSRSTSPTRREIGYTYQYLGVGLITGYGCGYLVGRDHLVEKANWLPAGILIVSIFLIVRGGLLIRSMADRKS